jgi:4-hydroxy-tetrahydrodipicolinate reductase
MTVGIIVAGATGWTGAAVTHGISDMGDLKLAGAVARHTGVADIGVVLVHDPVRVLVVARFDGALETPADVFVDLSTMALVKDHSLSAIEKNISVLIGASGMTAERYPTWMVPLANRVVASLSTISGCLQH